MILKTSKDTLVSTARPNKDNKVCVCVNAFETDPEHGLEFSCFNCERNLEQVTQLKKANVVIEYENANLKEQLEKTVVENNYLKCKIS